MHARAFALPANALILVGRQNNDLSSLTIGERVRLNSGGPAMLVLDIEGDQVTVADGVPRLNTSFPEHASTNATASPVCQVHNRESFRYCENKMEQTVQSTCRSRRADAGAAGMETGRESRKRA